MRYPDGMIAGLSTVRVLRPATGPLNLILRGREVGTAASATELAFAGAEHELPDDLEYANVSLADAAGGTWIVLTARGKFRVRARSAHLHRDVSATMRSLLPAQRAPVLRRLAWRALPALVSSSIGRRLIALARRR